MESNAKGISIARGGRNSRACDASSGLFPGVGLDPVSPIGRLRLSTPRCIEPYVARQCGAIGQPHSLFCQTGVRLRDIPIEQVEDHSLVIGHWHEAVEPSGRPLVSRNPFRRHAVSMSWATNPAARAERLGRRRNDRRRPAFHLRPEAGFIVPSRSDRTPPSNSDCHVDQVTKTPKLMPVFDSANEALCPRKSAHSPIEMPRGATLARGVRQHVCRT